MKEQAVSKDETACSRGATLIRATTAPYDL